MATHSGVHNLQDSSGRRSNPIWVYTLRIGLAWLVVCGLLFAGAGRLDWAMGWVFAALWTPPSCCGSG